MSVTTQPTAQQVAVGLQEVFRRHFKRGRNHVASGRAEQQHYRGRWSLAYAMRDMGLREGVEVGVQYGGSAEIWCSVNPQLHLIGIDPYEPYPDLRGRKTVPATREKTAKRLAPLNVTLIKNRSMVVVSRFRNYSLDFVHIDGDHSFDCCMQDLIRWVPKVRMGGLILVHDFCAANWNGVTQASNAYLMAHGITNWWCTRDSSPTLFWERLDSHT